MFCSSAIESASEAQRFRLCFVCFHGPCIHSYKGLCKLCWIKGLRCKVWGLRTLPCAGKIKWKKEKNMKWKLGSCKGVQVELNGLHDPKYLIRWDYSTISC